MIEITIPVLNEQKLLEQNVMVLYQFLHKEFSPGLTWSIVIADNGSTDHTRQIGENLILNRPNIRYIRLEEKGVGLALQTSWAQSNAAIVGYMDLDLATDLDHLIEAMEADSDGYDIVYATR